MPIAPSIRISPNTHSLGVGTVHYIPIQLDLTACQPQQNVPPCSCWSFINETRRCALRTVSVGASASPFIHHYTHRHVCAVFIQSKAKSPVCQHTVFSFTCTLGAHPLPWQKVHCPPRALRRRELQHFPVQHAPAHSSTVQLSRRFVPVWHIPLLRLRSNVEWSKRCFPPLITRKSPVRVGSINRLTHSRSASSLTLTLSLSTHTRARS